MEEKAKGKKPLTEEQQKKKKKKKNRDPEADSLRLQAPTRTDPAILIDPLGVMTEKERADALQAQLEYDQTNVLKAAQEEADKAEVTDALQAQKDELEKLKQESEAMKKVTDAKKTKEVEWFKRRLKNRKDDAKIVGATIQPPTTKSPKLVVIIQREDNRQKAYEVEWLEDLSISEWMEVGNFISKSKSKFKETIINAIRKLFIKMVNIQEKHNILVSAVEGQRMFLIKQGLTGEVIKHPRNKRKGHFAMLHDQGITIDASGLNLSLPSSVAQPESTIITLPEYGIYFEDVFGTIGFFRFRDIPNASNSFLQAILGVPQRSEGGDLIVRLLMNELKRRNQATDF